MHDPPHYNFFGLGIITCRFASSAALTSRILFVFYVQNAHMRSVILPVYWYCLALVLCFLLVALSL
jgi:hypothetical protein